MDLLKDAYMWLRPHTQSEFSSFTDHSEGSDFMGYFRVSNKAKASGP